MLLRCEESERGASMVGWKGRRHLFPRQDQPWSPPLVQQPFCWAEVPFSSPLMLERHFFCRRGQGGLGLCPACPSRSPCQRKGGAAGLPGLAPPMAGKGTVAWWKGGRRVGSTLWESKVAVCPRSPCSLWNSDHFKCHSCRKCQGFTCKVYQNTSDDLCDLLAECGREGKLGDYCLQRCFGEVIEGLLSFQENMISAETKASSYCC